jgi:cell division transport system ATP-binding protein
MELLQKINRMGTTVILATHNEKIVNTMRRRVIELRHGQLVRDKVVSGYKE